MKGTTQITNVAVTPSTDDLKVTLDPFGVASSILLAANTKCQVVTTRAQDLAGNLLDQNEAHLINQKKVLDLHYGEWVNERKGPPRNGVGV